MKICILSVVNIKHMSLISLYTSYFVRHNIEYDIVYIDKYDEEEYINAKGIYRYNINISRDWSFVRKLRQYLGFRKYAKSIINQKGYDFIIVWRTETALLFPFFLVSNFKNRYCLNIRDYFHEKNPIIYLLVKMIIKNARFSSISSNGFKSFLPQSRYLSVHSFNESILDNCTPRTELRKTTEPIRICFIGYVRFFDIDKKIIELFGNDKRFIVQYFGEGSHILEKFALEKEISNVEFHKGFKVEETLEFLVRADVINNLYGFGNLALDTAISTKFYYALKLNIPILVFKDTYMEEISRKALIGYSVEKDLSNLTNDFYDWYHSLNFEEISDSCSKVINSIRKDNSEFICEIKKII